jgi:hypothetical protein
LEAELLLGVAIGPDLVGLDHLAGEIDQHAVLMLGAGFPEIERSARGTI